MKRFISSGVPVIFMIALAVAFILAFAQPSLTHAAPSPVPTPPPLPTTTTPIAQPVIGIPAITNATGGQGGISAQDVRNYVSNHNIPDNMGDKHPTPSKIVELPAVQVGQLIHSSTYQPDDTMLWYVEFQGNVVFPGSSMQPDGVHFMTAYEVFLASNGNLIAQGGLNQPSGTPTPGTAPTPGGTPTATATASPQPTNTPAPLPTDTPTPVPPTDTPIPPTPPPVPPHLTATSPTEHCANANWLNPIILSNIGGQPLHWTGSIPISGHTLTPSSGNLNPGASVSVTIGPQFMNPYDGHTFPVNFTSNGGTSCCISSAMADRDYAGKGWAELARKWRLVKRSGIVRGEAARS